MSDDAGAAERGTSRALVVCVVAWLVAMLGAAAFAHLRAPPSSVALALAAAFIPYAPIALGRRSPRGVAWLAALAGAPLVFAPGALSDDLYRFLWDAKVAAAGLDPYAFAPSDAQLASLRDASWANVNHPDIPTVYPAGAQLLFLLGRALTDGPAGPRALALLGHLVVALVLARRGPTGSDAAWALNPLALSESALGGHVDVFVGLALLGAGVALVERRLPRATVFAMAAAAVKLVGLVALPFVARDRRALLLALALAALIAWPLTRAGDGSGVPGGFGNYARRWSGNAGVHLLLASGAERALVAVAGDHAGRVRVDALRPVLSRLAGRPLDPRASFTAEKKPVHDVAVFEAHVAASLVARAVALLLAVWLAFMLARRVRRGLDAAVALRALVLAVLLLAPQMHPWYLLWVLPLELAVRDVGGRLRLATTVWSAWALGTYAPLDVWATDRVWSEPPGFGLVAQLVVLTLLALELREPAP
ncbi:MAG: hypothetical protein KF901_22315 [Myxococcales bacterium]|nr:hypothetical protein [Myxococcales bacterium]